MTIERSNEGRNIKLTSDENIALFLWLKPGVFEVHMDFKLRGRDALNLMGEMLNSLNAKAVLAAIPPERRDVHWFARKCGFEFRREIATRIGPCRLFVRRF